MSEKKQLMDTKMRLFILGAPKCGTTSLAQWLAEHPGVHMSRIKEPHFYSTDLANARVRNIADYERLFADSPPKASVLAEASTWYLYSKAALPNIVAEHPDARFIVMTRDPTSMAVSLYYHNRFKRQEDCGSFEEAWDLQETRAAGHRIPANCTEPAFLQYGEACAVGTLLERARSRIEPSRLLHIRLENLQADVHEQWRRVLTFLELPDDGRSAFPVHNEAREARSEFLNRLHAAAARLKQSLGITQQFRTLKYISRPLEKKHVPARLLARVDAFFAGERRKLQEADLAMHPAAASGARCGATDTRTTDEAANSVGTAQTKVTAGRTV